LGGGGAPARQPLPLFGFTPDEIAALRKFTVC